MELYVLRHDRVLSNDLGIVAGRDNEELTEVGIKQVESIRDKLSDIIFDIIYSSDVRRAVQTAEIVNINGADVMLDWRLAERDPGNALGMKRKDIDKQYWNSLTLDRTPEGAETLKSGLIRTKSILDEIYEKHYDKRILIVTHNFNCKCIWMIEENITDLEEINSFFQENGEVRKYVKKR